jgi:Domain of unknown function (DUF1844)
MMGVMSDTPKFEVIDRRKFKAAEEEQEGHSAHPAEAQPESKPATEAASGPSAGPRLVVNESKAAPAPTSIELDEPGSDEELGIELPPLPPAEEVQLQKTGYEASAQRLEELIRAQNPAMGRQPAVTFPHLVQQFYVSAMIQMGAGGQEGQRPRVDILGAKGTIDLLNILAEKTRGNLTEAEDRALQTVLHEVRIAFNELVSMINLQAMQPPQPPPPGKR